MSNPLFVVLGRLTYCAYLMHFTVIYGYKFSLNSSSYFTETYIVYHYIGIYVLSYAIAFGVSLVMEAPLLTIEKTILFPPKPAKPQQSKEEISQVTLQTEREKGFDGEDSMRQLNIHTEIGSSNKNTIAMNEKGFA